LGINLVQKWARGVGVDPQPGADQLTHYLLSSAYHQPPEEALLVQGLCDRYSIVFFVIPGHMQQQI
jgi:hypothetical protein